MTGRFGHPGNRVPNLEVTSRHREPLSFRSHEVLHRSPDNRCGRQAIPYHQRYPPRRSASIPHTRGTTLFFRVSYRQDAIVRTCESQTATVAHLWPRFMRADLRWAIDSRGSRPGSACSTYHAWDAPRKRRPAWATSDTREILHKFGTASYDSARATAERTRTVTVFLSSRDETQGPSS
jgi:hypothetical protein